MLTLTTFVIDTYFQAPSLNEITPISTPSNINTPSVVIKSNEAGTISSSLSFSSTNICIAGNNTITFNALADNTYSGETVTVTDFAGNSTIITLSTFVIDTVAPTLNETTPINALSNDNTPSVVITSNEAGTISSSLGFSSTTSGIAGNNTITFNLLFDDTYSGETVTFTNLAGNSTTLTLSTFIINTTGATLGETVPINNPTNDTTPSVTIYSTKNGTITSSLGFSSTTNGIVGNNIITFNTLADNTYTGETVTFTDFAGNSTTITLSTFTIDTVAPVLSETTPISTPTNDITPSVVITSNKTGRISSSTLGFSTSTNIIAGNNTITFNALVDNTYIGDSVTVTDDAGNSTTITLTTFRIDSTGPTLSETTPISTPSNINTPQVVISSDEAGTISSSLGFSSTTSGIAGANTIKFNTLSDNTYSGETVTFTDAAGNSTTITLSSFTIDTVAPTLSETTPISTPTNNTTPSVVITSNESGTISSSLGFSSTTSGIDGENTITFNTLSDNTYTGVTVTFTDVVGNSTTLTLSTFTINTVGPTLSETTPIITPTNINTPSVVITSNEAGTISSSLGFISTTSGIFGDNTITFNTLSDGTYKWCYSNIHKCNWKCNNNYINYIYYRYCWPNIK